MAARQGARSQIVDRIRDIQTGFSILSQQLKDSAINRTWLAGQFGNPPWFDDFLHDLEATNKTLGFLLELAKDGRQAKPIRKIFRESPKWIELLKRPEIVELLLDPVTRGFVILESEKLDRRIAEDKGAEMQKRVAGFLLSDLPPGPPRRDDSSLADLAFPQHPVTGPDDQP